MSKSTTPRPAPGGATRPARLRNACCPKCDGPLYYHPAAWVFCTRCSARRRPIPFALTDRGAAK